MSINKTTTIFILFFILALFLFNSRNVFAISCTQVGDTSFCDNGTYYTQVGNTTFGSNGTTYSKVGNTTSLDRCPYNSFLDSVTNKCKCNNGYLSSGGSCVPANTVCSSQLGYQSSYDSISKNCKCNSGYIIGASRQCINANNYCVSQIGVMSRYNSLSNQCECTDGYEFNGSSCVRKNTSYSNIPIDSPSLPSVPVNTNEPTLPPGCSSTLYYSATTGISCDGTNRCGAGSQFNSDKTECVPVSKTTLRAITPVTTKALEIKEITSNATKLNTVNLNQAVVTNTTTETKPKSFWTKLIGWLGF